ncbi:unnamed protein product [Rhizophagus irregularis]|nr:unnamed protein product [Rhizophagus irregularis]
MRLCPKWIHDEEPKIRGKRGQIKRRWNGSQEVVVKEVHIPEEKEGGRKAIEKYAFFMSRLSDCNNIEKLRLWTLLINYTLYVVTEWTEEGDLEDFLRNNRELLWPLRLKIAEQIVNALEFINRVEIYTSPLCAGDENVT